MYWCYLLWFLSPDYDHAFFAIMSSSRFHGKTRFLIPGEVKKKEENYIRLCSSHINFIKEFQVYLVFFVFGIVFRLLWQFFCILVTIDSNWLDLSQTKIEVKIEINLKGKEGKDTYTGSSLLTWFSNNTGIPKSQQTA